jgi:hypothetical protein
LRISNALPARASDASLAPCPAKDDEGTPQ